MRTKAKIIKRAAVPTDPAISAVVSALPLGQGFATVQLNVHFIRGLVPGEGTVAIEGRLVRQGRRVMVAEAAMCSANRKLCAVASATCMPGG